LSAPIRLFRDLQPSSGFLGNRLTSIVTAVLLRRDLLQRIEAGEVDTVYRSWSQPRVKPGNTIRTPIGVIEVISVDEVDPAALSEADAASAGFDTEADLLAEAGSRGAILYRIVVRHLGEDPRVALRGILPEEADLADLLARLDRLDRSSRHGRWTAETLRLIADNPGVRAEDLARSVGREKHPFKLDVRKLKELGLTESLRVGYRLSPRGAAVVSRLGR
jgi:hypothetical protein